jgi:hypothetical protein
VELYFHLPVRPYGLKHRDICISFVILPRISRSSMCVPTKICIRLHKGITTWEAKSRNHWFKNVVSSVCNSCSQDFQGNRVERSKMPCENETNSSPLGRVNLRANLLKGNIVLGNYGVSTSSAKAITVSLNQISWTGNVLKDEHVAIN